MRKALKAFLLFLFLPLPALSAADTALNPKQVVLDLQTLLPPKKALERLHPGYLNDALFKRLPEPKLSPTQAASYYALVKALRQPEKLSSFYAFLQSSGADPRLEKLSLSRLAVLSDRFRGEDDARRLLSDTLSRIGSMRIDPGLGASESGESLKMAVDRLFLGLADAAPPPVRAKKPRPWFRTVGAIGKSTRRVLDSVKTIDPIDDREKLQATGRVLGETLLKSQGPRVKSILTALSDLDAPPLVQSIWTAMTRESSVPFLKKHVSLSALPKTERWFPGSQDVLKTRMPTLWAMLHDPQRLGLFLSQLSLLRGISPYYPYRKGKPELPVAWAKSHGGVFGLNELNIVPGSESFRRHIFYVEDAQGFFAVELKMPGDSSDRKGIAEEHFTASREMWEKYPRNPGVVQPLYYGQFHGRLPLYGEENYFPRKEPLAVMLFSYQDGNRGTNAAARIASIARRSKVAEGKIWLKALSSAAAAVIRFHSLGWSGNDLLRDCFAYDAHSENVRVLADGQAVLVGDFGSAHKERLDFMGRADETLSFLSLHSDDRILREMFPLVVESLSVGITDPEALEQIKATVREELHLWK